MIRDWLTPDKIKVINSIDSWENAVRLAAEPLADARVYSRVVY